jgi:chorismate mutase-like protein
MTALTAADPSRLAELRAKIDAIDESVHRLLMQRAMVIDELIEVKGTARNGAAFRPGREADMMRRLAQRHQGHLPLTAIEHLWREIISTFTALQAPFEVAVSTAGDCVAAIEAARFTFGFSVPVLPCESADDVVEWIEEGGDRLGVVMLGEQAAAWWEGLTTGQIVARLPFFEVPGREAGAPALVLAPPLADPVPFEVDCFVVSGPSRAVATLMASPILAAGSAETIAAEHWDASSSLLVATADAAGLQSEATALGLDIRPVGGYAAPFRLPG